MGNVTFHDPDGELTVQWVVLENAADPGFTVSVAIGGTVYRAKKDPCMSGVPRARVIRDVIVSALECELSRRMGLPEVSDG